jgi:hypothetical protein
MFKEQFIDWRLNNSNALKDFSILQPANDCVLFLEDSAFADLMSIAEKMNYEYTAPLNVHALHILKLYCQILIEKINLFCSQHSLPLANSVHYKTTQEFKTLVYQNINKTKSVADFA